MPQDQAETKQTARFPLSSMLWAIGIGLSVLIVAWFIRERSQSEHLPKHEGRSWELVFSDDFNKQKLDSSKWVTCYDWYNSEYDGCSNNGNHEWEWYMPSQVSVHDGVVRLDAVAAKTTGYYENYEKTYEYKSGMISTGRPEWNSSPKWTGSYGYYEARMRVASGKGVWPAFWLLPVDHSWPPEIDIMEILGHQPDKVLMTYHWPGADGKPQKDPTIYAGLIEPNGWHTYAIDWQPGRIDWYIDGIKRKTSEGKNIPSKPMEIILNLAIGGDLPGNPDPKVLKTAHAEVDYVRVYQLKK